MDGVGLGLGDEVSEADVLADGEMVGKFAATGIRVTFDPASYAAKQGNE